MKKITRRLGLRALTIRNLTAVAGGITIEPHPRTYGCPSQDTVTCHPKSDGCYTEVSCPTITQ